MSFPFKRPLSFLVLFSFLFQTLWPSWAMAEGGGGQVLGQPLPEVQETQNKDKNKDKTPPKEDDFWSQFPTAPDTQNKDNTSDYCGKFPSDKVLKPSIKSEASELKEEEYVRIGSTKTEVAYIQGTPKRIADWPSFEIWEFLDGSTITFKNNHVSGWNNNGQLKVSVVNEKKKYSHKNTAKSHARREKKSSNEYRISSSSSSIPVNPLRDRTIKPNEDGFIPAPVGQETGSANAYDEYGFVPDTAENGSYKGEISTKTGRPKNTYVHGYYRKNGTYVRGHYRS